MRYSILHKWYIAILCVFLYNTSSAITKDSIDIHNEVAFSGLQKGDIQVFNRIQQNISFAKQLNYKKGMALAYQNLGIYYSLTHQADSARQNLKSAIRLLNSIQDSTLILCAESSLGAIEYYLSNYYLAERHFNRSLKFIANNTPIKFIADALINQSMVYNVTGRYTEAQESLFKSLKYLQKDSLPLIEAKVYSNIGSTYHNTKDLNKSIEYFHKARNILNKLEMKLSLAALYNNLGGVYFDMNEPEMAIISYKQALEIYLEENKILSSATCYTNLAQVYNELKQTNKALDYIERALLIKERHNDVRGQMFALLAVAEIHFNSGNYQSTIQYANKAFRLAQQLSSKKEENIIYYLKARAFAEQNKHKKAFEFLHLYSLSKDSLVNVQKSKAIANLETHFQLYLKEQELKNSEQTIELLNSEKRINKLRNQSIYLFVIILFLILSLVLFRLRTVVKLKQQTIEKNKKLHEANLQISESKLQLTAAEKEKLKNQLEYNKETMKLQAFQLIKKDDFINAVQKEIKNIKSLSPKKEVSQSLNQLQHLIKLQLKLDQEREEFSKETEKLNEDFLNQLGKKHPDLSTDEKRLCVYLRLNLSSKEIAPLFGISPKSVDMKRFRLRKKLQVQQDISISEVLQAF
jgi:tetratricopeptide (TPR) repeat protein/DNA-binding CsgD family transcriptional regulator